MKVKRKGMKEKEEWLYKQMDYIAYRITKITNEIKALPETMTVEDYHDFKTDINDITNLLININNALQQNPNGELKKEIIMKGLEEGKERTEIFKPNPKKKITFERGKIARAKRDVLAKELKKHKEIVNPYALATWMIKKGYEYPKDKFKLRDINIEFEEQKKEKEKGIKKILSGEELVNW